jgi:hypothetical protein
MRYLIKIPSGANDYEFIKKELGIKGNELCYIISNHDDIDGQIDEFNKAFDEVYGRGFGSLILNIPGDKLYLETELTQGQTK